MQENDGVDESTLNEKELLQRIPDVDRHFVVKDVIGEGTFSVVFRSVPWWLL